MRRHPRFKFMQHGLRVAHQESLGIGDIVRIGLGRDVADARAGATLDLIEQTRPGAIGIHGVLAGPQLEHLLQQLDRFLHRPGARVRPEVAVLAVGRSAVIGEPRECVRGNLQVRIALVVAEQDVVARLQALDEVVLEQQRLGLGPDHRGLHPHDLADHVADAGAAVALLEIVGDAPFQVARLAHVEHRTGGIEIAVDAGQLRQGSDFAEQLIGMRFGHDRDCRASRIPRCGLGWHDIC